MAFLPVRTPDMIFLAFLDPAFRTYVFGLLYSCYLAILQFPFHNLYLHDHNLQRVQAVGMADLSRLWV